MRYCKFLIIVIIASLPAGISAQTTSLNEIDLSGLWKGTLYNDSTKKYYRYEIGISQEKGKLSGFSHTFFLVNDKEFYGVKKIKVRRSGSKVIVEDAGLIANNYPEAPAKGVKQLNVLTLEIKDSILILSGPFSTNRTKEYSSLTGTVSLQRKNDFWQSALVPHLQELGISENLSFVKKELEKRKEEAYAKTQKDVAVNKTLQGTIKNYNKETGSVESKSATGDSGKATTIVKEKNREPVKVLAPAAEVSSRENVVQQTVYFSSDSLLLTLYDNGEVDGDTVSVLINGKIILAKEGLSTNAIRKTIYPAKDTDSVELVMYAENLGTIAPNTGLLVVHDGKSIYEIRFSGDLKKNASIILRRRKNNE